VASNPEFLREGKALKDAMNPDCIIIGANCEKASKLISRLYESLKCPIMITKPRTAEFIKYAANAFLATKITFINELAKLSDRMDVNIKEVALGIGLDQRMGQSFLQAGIGYGGSSLPKDVAALLNTAKQHQSDLKLLEYAEYVNQTQYLYLLEKARERLGTFAGRNIAVLGISFKPDTDDIREAPAIRIIRRLCYEKAFVNTYDPIAALPTAFRGKHVKNCSTPEEAMKGVDAIFLCTEWAIFNNIDWDQVKESMNQPNLFDGRNMLDANHMKSKGFFYQGIGYA
jgi:UDPglucose 6-dehydrogenase